MSKRFNCCCMFVKRFDVARSLLTTSFQCCTEEEAFVSVSMTLNIDYHQLSADDKDELKGKVRDGFAKGADVGQSAVSVTLTPGSVLPRLCDTLWPIKAQSRPCDTLLPLKVGVRIRTFDANGGA